MSSCYATTYYTLSDKQKLYTAFHFNLRLIWRQGLSETALFQLLWSGGGDKSYRKTILLFTNIVRIGVGRAGE